MPRSRVRAKPRKKKTHNEGPTFGKQVWSGVGVVAILLGLLQGVFWLLPEVSVNPESPLNPDPFSAPFVVQNSGQFSVHNVDVSCYTNTVVIPGQRMSERNLVWSNGMPPLPQLEPGEKTTIHCAREGAVEYSSPITYADVSLIISYRPSFAWFSRSKQIRFQTRPQSDGRLRWEPEALSFGTK